MTKIRRFFTRSNLLRFTDGSRLGIKSAFIGSIVFAIVEIVTILINSYWINPTDSTLNTEAVWFYLLWFIAMVVGGSILAFLPALLLGALLASILNHDTKKQVLSKNKAVIKGLLVGGTAGLIICLPIVIIEYYSIQSGGHGDINAFLYRTLIAVVIAAGAGGWVSKQLATRYQT
jgi:hypothetical protein